MSNYRAATPTALAVALAGILAACEEPPTATPEPGLPVLGGAAPTTDFDVFLEDVEFRPGATADIHIRIYVNESLPCRDPLRTAFAIHGINATAASWGRFADAFFVGPSEEQLCLIAAIDHPGHGLSGLPQGVLFGELIVEDYARAVMEVLDRLSWRGIHPTILMGHSQGTLTIQAMQQTLREEGSSLRDRFGVRDAVFFGTQGPMQLPAEFVLPDAALEASIEAAKITTEEKGTFVPGPPEVFQLNWFINLDLALSSDAPSVEEIAAGGWNADIPLFAVLQAVGVQGFNPPPADPGVLASSLGTTLHLIHFADDPWSLNAAAIYEYLTGDASLSGFIPVTDPDNEAVHLYNVTDPDRVRSFIDLPRARGERAASH